MTDVRNVPISNPDRARNIIRARLSAAISRYSVRVDVISTQFTVPVRNKNHRICTFFNDFFRQFFIHTGISHYISCKAFFHFN